MPQSMKVVAMKGATVYSKKLPKAVPVTASGSFTTLHVNAEKYRSWAEGWSKARGLGMADLRQGAFLGTRGKSRSSTQPRPESPLVSTTSKSPANSRPRASTPTPKKAGLAGTPPKSALKQEYDDDSTAKRQKKHVRLNLLPPAIQQFVSDAPVSQTPAPQSATVRTPSITIKFNKKPPSVSTPASAATPVAKKPKTPATNGATPTSAQKRKRSQGPDGSEDELAKRPAQIRKLTLTQKPAAALPPKVVGLTLKTKGKIAKRPLGVGYDSELEEREQDPVVLDGFILRMKPGADCDYIQNSISNGSIGVSVVQGGANIKILLFDAQGRRGVLTVRDHKYAIAMVDLPCIVEGMKSWDKKGWIKSIDISQMMLVLGLVKQDEDAKLYPLPPEVDPKTFQYADGLTPPMKNVRKRRFARTNRARLHDIEAVERRVAQLIAADEEALSTSYAVFDHDPRLDQDIAVQSDATGSEMYSGTEEDAEGEDEEDMQIPDDYFANQPLENRALLEPNVYVDTPEDDAADAVADFEAAFDMSEDEEELTNGVDGDGLLPDNKLHPPDEVASSFAVTSTSVSPAPTAAQTPVTVADGASDADDDNEDDDEDGSEEESDEDEDQAEKEDDEAMQQAKDRIHEMLEKIMEQEKLLAITANPILKKKIRAKIEAFKGDVLQMRRTVGLATEEDGE